VTENFYFATFGQNGPFLRFLGLLHRSGSLFSQFRAFLDFLRIFIAFFKRSLKISSTQNQELFAFLTEIILKILFYSTFFTESLGDLTLIGLGFPLMPEPRSLLSV
jgi:hypothetical protein